MFLNLCAAKDFGKKLSGKSNIALFTREICNIRSEDSFYLKRTILGRKFTRETVNSGEELFFRDHIILGRKLRIVAEVRRELRKIPIMCHGQNNSIFRIKLILGTKARNLSTILGENFFLVIT